MQKRLRRRDTKAALSQAAAALGRKGGRIGGKRRLETMTAEERQARARHAAQARWAKARTEEEQ